MLDHHCEHHVLLCHLSPITFHQTLFQDHIKCSLQHHLHSPQRESKLKTHCHCQISFVFLLFFWIRNWSCQIISYHSKHFQIFHIHVVASLCLCIRHTRDQWFYWCIMSFKFEYNGGQVPQWRIKLWCWLPKMKLDQDQVWNHSPW